MGIKNQLKWVSAGHVTPHNTMAELSLVGTEMIQQSDGSMQTRYVPTDQDWMLAHGRVLPDFTDWWHGAVIRDSHGELFSRQHIALTLANKDGGAHIDKLQASMRRLAHEGGMGLRVGSVLPDQEVFNDFDLELVDATPLLACMRTIADEIALTISKPAGGVVPPPMTSGTARRANSATPASR
jgi:hypothetical protein